MSALAALVAVVSLVIRLPAAEGRDWPLPIEECRAAVRAVADIEGLVFVNVGDTNPLMYLAPIHSPVALKPVAMLPFGFFKGTRSVRFLFAESLGGPVPSAAETVRLPDLPPGWSLVSLEDWTRLWPGRA